MKQGTAPVLAGRIQYSEDAPGDTGAHAAYVKSLLPMVIFVKNKPLKIRGLVFV
jgi:hypothetical protein